MEENFTKKVILKDDLAKLTSQNTEYQMALKQKEISGKTINLKRADLKPTVAGVVTYGASNKTKISDLAKEKSYNGTVGLNMSWDIFDWGAKKYEVHMKKVYYQLQALEKSLEAKRIAVEKAEEVYELEQERYNYNLITMKNLLDAETNLRQSRTEYESTRLKYYYLISRYGAFLD